MQPVLGSGFFFVTEIGPDAFRDIVLGPFRSFVAGICGSGGVWYNDLVIDAANQQVRLIQISGDPPTSHDDIPVPPIPFDDLVNGNYADLFDFQFWPLVRTRPSAQLHLKPIDGGAIAVGYQLSQGDDIAAFNAFNANALTVDGLARDFLVAADGDVITGHLVATFDGIFTMGMPIPFLTSTEPRFESISIRDNSPNGGAVAWRQPWSFVIDTAFHIGDELIDVLAPGTAWFEVTADGGLDLQLRILPQDIDPGLDDQFEPFYDFNNDERDATAAKLTFVMATGLMQEFRDPPLAGEPDPVRITALGLATVRIYDPNFRALPLGAELPALLCEGLTVDATSLRLHGAVRRTVQQAPHLIITPTSVTFTEELTSACGAAAQPDFGVETVDLRNTGAGPLFICRQQINITGPDGASFNLSLSGPRPGDIDGNLTLESGEIARLTIYYLGGRGVSAHATITIVSNDPMGPIRHIGLQTLSGATSFAVDPSPLSIRRANNPAGRPVMTLNVCNPAPVRVNAGEFQVTNTGVNPLHLCGLQLNDPDNVLIIPFNPRRIDPGSTTYFGVLFFPLQAAHTYNATCTLTFAGGAEFVLAIDARVELLPQPGEPGEWVDLSAGYGCALLENLCIWRGLFEPVIDQETLPIVNMRFEGLPTGGELILRDGHGRAHLSDRSGLRERAHALAYTPNPDGGPTAGDPCRGEIPGFGPHGPVGPDPGPIPGPGPEPDPSPYRVDVSGWLVRPEGKPVATDGARFLAAGGFVHAVTADGLAIIAGDGKGGARLEHQRGAGRPDAIAYGRGLVALGEKTKIALLAATSGTFGKARSKATLDRPITALALLNDKVIVGDADALSIHDASAKTLKQLNRLELPGGVHALRRVGKTMIALGEALFQIEIGEDGNAWIAARIDVGDKTATLSTYRGVLILSGKAGAQSFGVISGKLRHLADYPLGHWSTAFMSGGQDGVLFKPIENNQLQMHRVTRHEFDRRKFEKAYTLQYRPKRPEKART